MSPPHEAFVRIRTTLVRELPQAGARVTSPLCRRQPRLRRRRRRLGPLRVPPRPGARSGQNVEDVGASAQQSSARAASRSRALDLGRRQGTDDRVDCGSRQAAAALPAERRAVGSATIGLPQESAIPCGRVHHAHRLLRPLLARTFVRAAACADDDRVKVEHEELGDPHAGSRSMNTTVRPRCQPAFACSTRSPERKTQVSSEPGHDARVTAVDASSGRPQQQSTWR